MRQLIAIIVVTVTVTVTVTALAVSAAASASTTRSGGVVRTHHTMSLPPLYPPIGPKA